jgi:hypothetical protein
VTLLSRSVTPARRRTVIRLLSSVCALLPSVASLAAQSTANVTAAEAPRRNVWQVGVFLGGAHDSPNDGVLGTIPHRDHYLMGMQAGTEVLRIGALRVSYIAQLIPLFIISDRTAANFDPFLDSSGIARLPERAYAFGVSPFGLELSSPSQHRVSVYAASSGGGLLFTRPFPDVTGRRSNFTLEAGGGFRIRVGTVHWAQVGYKYHHISNAGTAFANPGLDGNVFYAGYQWTARLPQ